MCYNSLASVFSARGKLALDNHNNVRFYRSLHDLRARGVWSRGIQHSAAPRAVWASPLVPVNHVMNSKHTLSVTYIRVVQHYSHT